MAELIAALADFSGLLKDAVHGPHRVQVGAFVQQGREDLGRRRVTKALRMENLKGPGGVRWVPRRGANSAEARVEPPAASGAGGGTAKTAAR
jgi:hypothetical protein